MVPLTGVGVAVEPAEVASVASLGVVNSPLANSRLIPIRTSALSGVGSAIVATLCLSTKFASDSMFSLISCGTWHCGANSSDWKIVQSLQLSRTAVRSDSLSPDSAASFSLSAAWLSAHASVARGFPGCGGFLYERICLLLAIGKHLSFVPDQRLGTF